MIEAWFIILSLMIAIFAVLEGWDFGVGTLHYIVARNPDERRIVMAALGPLWGWHEVWLLATGGVLFAAFPRVLSIAFPAYYLALYLVLWNFILRGISLEFRSHLPDPLWRAFWDFTFAFSNVALAILFGAAIGNVMRGMPLAADAQISLPFFTNFGVSGNVGLLDWYTISVAVFTLICLAAHGASYLAIKTEGEVYRRSKTLSGRLWTLTFVLLAFVSLETSQVRPELFAGMSSRPAAWAALLAVAASAAAIVTGLRSGAEHRTFLGGCTLIAGLLATAAASLFPVMLHSTLDPKYSITAWNSASDSRSLQIAAYWWPIAFGLTLGYFAVVAKQYQGRVQLSKADAQQPY